MPSPFAAALLKMDAALDRQLGETITVTPVVVGDYGCTPDASRPPFSVTALVHEVDPSSADTGGLHTRVRFEEWEIEIDRAVLGARSLAKGDHVVLDERPGTPALSIARIDTVDRGRLRLTLAIRS